MKLSTEQTLTFEHKDLVTLIAREVGHSHTITLAGVEYPAIKINSIVPSTDGLSWELVVKFNKLNPPDVKK